MEGFNFLAQLGLGRDRLRRSMQKVLNFLDFSMLLTLTLLLQKVDGIFDDMFMNFLFLLNGLLGSTLVVFKVHNN